MRAHRLNGCSAKRFLQNLSMIAAGTAVSTVLVFEPDPYWTLHFLLRTFQLGCAPFLQ
jgi:hypothetical protein